MSTASQIPPGANIILFNIEEANRVADFLHWIKTPVTGPTVILIEGRGSSEAIKLFGEMLHCKGLEFQPLSKTDSMLLQAQEAIAATRPDLYSLEVVNGAGEVLKRKENFHDKFYQHATSAEERRCKWEPSLEPEPTICDLNCGTPVKRPGLCRQCSQLRQRQHHFHQPKWRKGGGRK